MPSLKWRYDRERGTWINAGSSVFYIIKRARSGGYLLAKKGHQSFEFPFTKLKNAKLVAELIEEG